MPSLREVQTSRNYAVKMFSNKLTFRPRHSPSGLERVRCSLQLSSRLTSWARDDFIELMVEIISPASYNGVLRIKPFRPALRASTCRVTFVAGPR
jgi:hypothetical protein